MMSFVNGESNHYRPCYHLATFTRLATEAKSQHGKATTYQADITTALDLQLTCLWGIELSVPGVCTVPFVLRALTSGRADPVSPS